MALVASQVEAGYERAAVLRGVSCAIAPASVTAILGPNGAGKTTLLRVLLGALTPTGGHVTLDGVPLRSVPAPARARRVALIPQATTPDLPYSALEVVRLGRISIAEPSARATDAAQLALDRVGLSERASEPVGTLSAGQQQRVLLARALAQLDAAGNEPAAAREPGGDSAGTLPHRYLLADEPVASMDPRHALASMEILAGLARVGVGIGVVLHDFALAARFARRCILLAGDGAAVFEGSTDEALEPERLRAVFGVEFERLTSGSFPRVPVAVRPVDC